MDLGGPFWKKGELETLKFVLLDAQFEFSTRYPYDKLFRVQKPRPDPDNHSYLSGRNMYLFKALLPKS